MAIDVECRGCNARYRVKDEMAGRMVECKHCGQKFRVPYRSAVVRLGDEEELATPVAPAPKPAGDKGGRSFVEYGLDPNDPTAPIGKPKKERPRVQQGMLPELVLDLWLPLGLMIVCYGIALYTIVNYVLRSNGVLAGMILLGIVAAMFFALVIPMTMRMLEGASKTLDFEAPNSIWLQTAGCLALPTMGLVVGLLKGGSIAGGIAGGLIGFAVMVPLMTLMFRVDILKGVQAAVLGGMFYALSLAGTGLVIAAIGLWLMPLWNITRPWDDRPVEVAKTDTTTPKLSTTPEPAAAPVAAVAETPDASATKVDATDKPTEPEAPTDPWEVAIDSWPGSGRWPADVSHILSVRPPVNLMQTAAHEPFVALVDSEALKVFDLRSGKRIGAINERPRPGAAAISKDGQFIAFEVVMTSGAVPPSIEVWSVPDGKMILRIPAQGRVRTLGFDTSSRMYVLNHDEGKPVVQGWDVRTRRQVSSTPLEGDLGAFAVSANARLLATVRPGQLTVYDLQEGKLAGRRAIEPGFQQVGPVAFSLEGNQLLAAVSGDAEGAPRVLVWDMKDGAMGAPLQIPAVGPGDLNQLEMQWMPDGEGFLVHGQMIDRATSRTIVAAPPLTVGGVAGRARFAPSYFRMLFEVPPAPGGDRMIYRMVDFPRGEVITSMKAIRGADWEPAPEREPAADVVAVAAAPMEPDASAATRAAVPSTRPSNPAALKEWVVSVLGVIAPDGPSIERQIQAARTKLRPLELKFQAAANRADSMAGDFHYVYEGPANRRRKVQRFSPKEIGEAKGIEKRALEEVKDVKAELARLERELRSVTTARTVTGTLDDGTPVTMVIDNAAHALAVDPLQPGAKIRVTGGPRFANGTLEIKLRTIAPAE